MVFMAYYGFRQDVGPGQTKASLCQSLDHYMYPSHKVKHQRSERSQKYRKRVSDNRGCQCGPSIVRSPERPKQYGARPRLTRYNLHTAIHKRIIPGKNE